MAIEEQRAEDLDLVLTRTIDVRPEQVWQAWTRPHLVRKWFAPAPWTTVDCEIDLRPGGIFRTVMRSPEGEEVGGAGCFLEVAEPRRLVWTDALAPGLRPATSPFFTAVLTFEEHGHGTRYTARALHKDAADRRAHEEMGFREGWGQCLEQLVAVAKQLRP